MNNPTFQLLAALIVVLVGIMAAVLLAVRHANRQVPGLQAWALSYLFGFLLCLNLLARPYTPEALSLISAQVLIFVASWLNLLAARTYAGRKSWPQAYPACALLVALGLSSYWIWWQPDPRLRIALTTAVSGTLMLLSAAAMLTPGPRLQPARYLFTLACGGHGLLLLASSLVLLLGKPHLPDPERTWAVAQFVMLESIVVLVMRAFGVLMLVNAHITAELRHFAERDPLTNVFNRRTFMQLLDKFVKLMQRMNSPLSLLAIDLDHFKRINDSWGHGSGDQALRHFVRVASEHLRSDHVMGRMGGEEFLIFLPNTSRDNAAKVAERLRAQVEAQTVADARGPIALTVSIGVTEIKPQESQEAVLQRADQAMYQAKANGRNRVELA